MQYSTPRLCLYLLHTKVAPLHALVSLAKAGYKYQLCTHFSAVNMSDNSDESCSHLLSGQFPPRVTPNVLLTQIYGNDICNLIVRPCEVHWTCTSRTIVYSTNRLVHHNLRQRNAIGATFGSASSQFGISCMAGAIVPSSQRKSVVIISAALRCASKVEP